MLLSKGNWSEEVIVHISRYVKSMLSELSSTAVVLWHLLFKGFGVSRLSFSENIALLKSFQTSLAALYKNVYLNMGI